MATNFPTSVDNFTNPTANDSLNSPSHSTQHANANDAIEAIETSLLPGGVNYPGLVHLNTTSFSAQSSIAISNVFSATYNAYKIVLTNLICASSSQTVFMRYRAGGVDSAGNYHQSGYVSYTPGSVLAFAGGNDSTNIQACVANSGYRTSATIEVQNPYLAVSTGAFQNHQYWDASNFYGYNINSLHLPATQHDGFRIYPNSSTISGTVSVYGYRLS